MTGQVLDEQDELRQLLEAQLTKYAGTLHAADIHVAIQNLERGDPTKALFIKKLAEVDAELDSLPQQ